MHHGWRRGFCDKMVTKISITFLHSDPARYFSKYFFAATNQLANTIRLIPTTSETRLVEGKDREKPTK